MISSLLSFIFPPICPFCYQKKNLPLIACDACLELVVFNPEKKEFLFEAIQIMEVYCYEKTFVIEKFVKSLFQDEHPRKTALALSFYIHKIYHLAVSWDGIFCEKKKGLCFLLSKKLSRSLGIDFYLSPEEIKGKNVLLLEKSFEEQSFFLKNKPVRVCFLHLYG